MKKTKDGRYVIDETNILPDLLENQKKCYLNEKTKELMYLNPYEHFTITFSLHPDRLIEIPNEKAAKILFKDNRQKLPRTK